MSEPSSRVATGQIGRNERHRIYVPDQQAMKVTTFTADSAADAVAQIRAQLGPEAMVLSVRPLPCQGLSRLWQKPRLEVLATLPEPRSQSGDALDQLRQEVAELKQ